MRLTFEGATETVTGSCTLLTANNKKILVDCGLYEGEAVEGLNSRNLLFDPKQIDYILLTHAHIDHSGKIPYLVKKGFKGKVICTKPTLDLCEIVLPDSGYIQQKMKKWDMPAKKKRELVLYDMEEAIKSLNQFESVDYDEEIKIDEDIYIKFINSGHMLGSAYIELRIKEKNEETKVVFTGDLGNPNNNMLQGLKALKSADVLIMESTYGDRLHEETVSVEEQIKKAIIETVDRGGKLIIPAFAVGRTQETIVYLKNIYKNLDVHYKVPVYVDSPLAIDAFDRFSKNIDYLKDEIRERFERNDDPISFTEMRLVKELDESQEISKKDESMIIVSASGMADFGRVREHIKNNIGYEKNTIMFSGYLAEGTLGREIKKGKRNVKILGEKHKVRAHVKMINGMSGHLDMNGLISFIKGLDVKPEQIYLNHGTDDAKDYLKNELKKILTNKTDVIIAKRDIDYELKAGNNEKSKNIFDVNDFYNRKATTQEKILFSIYGQSIYDANMFQGDSEVLASDDNMKQIENLRKLGYKVS